MIKIKIDKNDLIEILNSLNVQISESKFLKPTKKNLKKYNLDPSKVTINSDGSIDYDGDVYLSERNLKEIPFKFNKVGGSFWCENNKLTSLEFAPQEVGGDFWCSGNQLTTLEFAPKKVGGSIYN